MKPVPNYLLDSDVLITAKNRYYAFTICPGFWESVLHGHSCGRLHSIDRVRQELLNGSEDDDLVLLGWTVRSPKLLSREWR